MQPPPPSALAIQQAECKHQLACRMMKSTKMKLYIGRLDRDLKSKHISWSATETLEGISREAMDMENSPRDRLKALELAC